MTLKLLCNHVSRAIKDSLLNGRTRLLLPLPQNLSGRQWPRWAWTYLTLQAKST